MGKFVSGDEVCYMDFYFFENLQLMMFETSGKILKDFPQLAEYNTRMKNLPKLKEYLANPDVLDASLCFNGPPYAKINGFLGFENPPVYQKERTFIMIKPDGVQRGLIGQIIQRFETKGFKLVAMKVCQPGKAHLEKHYDDLKSKKFFPGLIEYMTSGPVCAMVWEGDNAVLTGRKMLGATKPLDSEPGTIRGDFCIDVGRNIIHGSDAVVAADQEIHLWFPIQELVSYKHHSNDWVYE